MIRSLKSRSMTAFSLPSCFTRTRLRGRSYIRIADVTLEIPVDIRNYTDFYASIHHATNVGKKFRPDNPLLPNYRHVPIAYHGRASSIVISGTPMRRPRGQLGEGKFGPTEQLDYELELGVLIRDGQCARQNRSRLRRAHDHIFGFVLVNDWSARDIQRWEYQPLGPFLGKSFATSVSPFVISPEALKPYRLEVAGSPRTLALSSAGRASIRHHL